MPDSRFFSSDSPLKIAEAVAISGAVLASGDAEGVLSCARDIDESDLSDAVVFCLKADRISAMKGRTIGLCITTEALASRAEHNGAIAVSSSPRLAFAKIAERLHGPTEFEDRMQAFDPAVSVNESAVISSSAKLEANVRIGAHVYIGPGVVIGEGSVIESGVSITHALIGKHVTILSGARIGQAGFGFVESPEGLVRVPQLGRVVIGDRVEIGANTTIDRGALNDTMIGQGSKIDNLVQIGHNVHIGRSCVIAAMTGISGSCVIEDGVFVGGMVGFTDHLTIGAGAQIAAGAGLMRDVPAGEKWGGRPARPIRDWLRETSVLAKLAKKKSD